MKPGSPAIQIFGLVDDPSTRAAQRFFKERRIDVHFVDLRRRPIAPGELHRFADRLGPRALLDAGGRAARQSGLAHLALADAELVERLIGGQRLLRLPLVRCGTELAVGRDEAAWRAISASARPD
ncbi:MAG: arsenate reductase family protein [Candidatus Limnocylindrales bacterium]